MENKGSSRLLTLPREIRDIIIRHYCKITDIFLEVNISMHYTITGSFSCEEREGPFPGMESGLPKTCRLLRAEFITQAASYCSLFLRITGSYRPGSTGLTRPEIKKNQLRRLVPTDYAANITNVRLHARSMRSYGPFEDKFDGLIPFEYAYELVTLHQWLPSVKTLLMSGQSTYLCQLAGRSSRSNWTEAVIQQSPTFEYRRDCRFQDMLYHCHNTLGRPEDRPYRIALFTRVGLYEVEHEEGQYWVMVCNHTTRVEFTDEGRML